MWFETIDSGAPYPEAAGAGGSAAREVITAHRSRVSGGASVAGQCELLNKLATPPDGAAVHT